VVGRHRVTGSVEVGNGKVIGSAVVDVVAGPLAVLDLDPPEATVAAGDGQRYRAYGSDAYGNRLDEVTDRATFTISPNGSCPGSTCTAAHPGSHTVTGTVRLGDRSIVGTATLVVTAGDPDVRIPEDVASLDLNPRSRTIQAGTTITYTATAIDAKGNPLGALPAEPRFTISPDGSCAGATCTATRLGRHTVTGTLEAGNRQVTGTAIVDVVAGPLATLTVGPPAIMTSGQSQSYRAYGSDSYGNNLGEVTDTTTFTIDPDGSCTGVTCTATELGRHTVTGAVDVAGRTVTGATPLLVLSSAITGVTLNPRVAEIRAAGKVTYTATGVDGADRAVVDLTEYTTFSIAPEGSCTRAICTASELGEHAVTGTVQSPGGVISAGATLRVIAPEIVRPPGTLAGLELNPKSVESPAGRPVTYIAIGVDANGTRLDNLTAATRFSISPDGSCAGATCTAATPGPHTVTGTISGTIPSGFPGGDRSGIMTAGTTNGDEAVIVTAGFTAASNDVTGSASLQATAAYVSCLLSKGNVRSLDVTPGEGVPGSSVRIEGRLDSRFATCPVVLLLGGSGPGRDTSLEADGSTYWDWTVPSDASQGTTTMTLTTIDGQVLVSRQFEVLSGSDARSPLWFVLAVLVLAALGTAAASAERDRRQRRWVGEHVRTEPHADPGRVSTGRAHDTAPTIGVRLQPHADPGTTTITKEGDR
jgi:hypothetical protein